MIEMNHAASRLAALYAKGFGGKPSGRYRISAKQVREMLNRRRLYSDDIVALTRAMLEQGFILIEMDSFFVVLSANAFTNYRRASAEAVKATQTDV
jgi:hypothetical protein